MIDMIPLCFFFVQKIQIIIISHLHPDKNSI